MRIDGIALLVVLWRATCTPGAASPASPHARPLACSLALIRPTPPYTSAWVPITRPLVMKQNDAIDHTLFLPGWRRAFPSAQVMAVSPSSPTGMEPQAVMMRVGRTAVGKRRFFLNPHLRFHVVSSLWPDTDQALVCAGPKGEVVLPPQWTGKAGPLKVGGRERRQMCVTIPSVAHQ